MSILNCMTDSSSSVSSFNYKSCNATSVENAILWHSRMEHPSYSILHNLKFIADHSLK